MASKLPGAPDSFFAERYEALLQIEICNLVALEDSKCLERGGVSGRSAFGGVRGHESVRHQFQRGGARRGQASRGARDGVVPGVDAHRVSERQQHRGIAARVPGVRVVDRREGGGRWIGGLREGPSHQCAGWAVQGIGVGECAVAASGEALGVRHRNEARVMILSRLAT